MSQQAELERLLNEGAYAVDLLLQAYATATDELVDNIMEVYGDFPHPELHEAALRLATFTAPREDSQ